MSQSSLILLLYAVSDAVIGLAYLAIAGALLYLVYRAGRAVPFHRAVLAVGGVIVAGGVVRLIDVWSGWSPGDGLSAIAKAFTALASAITALFLPRLVPRALALIEAASVSQERALRLGTLETIVGSLEQGLVIADGRGDVVRMNPAALRLFGLGARDAARASLAELEERFQLTHADGRALPPGERPWARLARGEQFANLELRGRRVGTDEPWIGSVGGTPVRGASGELTLALLTVRDITAQKAVERERVRFLASEQAARAEAEATAARLQRLQAVTDAVLTHLPLDDLLRELLGRVCTLLGCDSATVLLLEPDGQNFAVRASFGLEREVREVEGLRVPVGEGFAGRIAQAQGPVILEDLPTVKLASPHLARRGLRSLLGLPLLVEGRVIGVVYVGSVTPRRFTEDDGRLLRLVAERLALTIERTRLWEAEQQARAEAEAARHRLSFLAEASTILGASLDSDKTLTSLARVAVPQLADYCLIYVAGEDGLIRTVATAHREPDREPLLRELASLPPHPRRPRAVAKVLRTGHPEVAPDGRRWRIDLLPGDRQAEIHARLGIGSYMVVPLVARGRTFGAISFVAAESERRYAEADLSLAEELAHRAALAIDNARLYEAAQEANRSKDEFLAMLSHELRNPLAPIQTAAHVIRRVAGGGEPLQRAVAIVERQVKHLARLLDDLLDVSRITRGKIDLRKTTVDLAVVVRHALEATQALIDARHHEVRVELSSTPCWIDADPTRLEQVVINLLANAAKYTEPGGRITVTVAAERGQAVLRVRDTGVGIPPEMLGRIFDLFTQVDASLARSEGGLGLGLTLVRSLVEMHGGMVTAHSAGRGRGSEFVVRLPLARASASPAPPAAEDRPPTPARSRHVLVVEDNRDAREMLRTALELQGHRVEVAEDGAAGVERALAAAPELILVDIGLPRMDGYEVARRIRARLGDRVSLVAITGYGRPEDRRRAQEAGFDAHLVKPVDVRELSRLLAG